VRYLTCSVCASSWHRTRVECATCGAPGKVSYFAIDHPSAKGVKAEACSACGTYLKLFYREERPEAEPVADDLATLALDLLMGDEGFARGGSNWFLAP
jgi:FdhE protein